MADFELTGEDTRRIGALLDFWFGAEDKPREIWFQRDDTFDETLRARFLDDHLAASAGRLGAWHATPEGSLALVLLLDQLPRNLFRGSPRAWASDGAAREAARQALTAGHDRAVSVVRRVFLYLPFEHSEDLADQEESVRLFGAMTEHPEHAELLRYAERHREIIERFGRFPHRNAILGRASTPEEIAFLKEPDSSF